MTESSAHGSKTLVTRRFRLVYPRLEDDERTVASFHRLLTHSDTLRYIPVFSSSLTLDETRAMVASHRTDTTRLGFDIFDQATNEWAGTVGLTRMTKTKAEAGIMLDPQSKASGIVSETMLSVLQFGFGQEVNLDEVGFATSRRNTKMLGWIEHVLLLQPIPDHDLTEQQVIDRDSWGQEDALVYFTMSRLQWEQVTGPALKARVEGAQRNK